MSAPRIRNVDTPEEFDQFAESMAVVLQDAGGLDYSSLYRELHEMSVELSENPTLQLLNAQLKKVQAAKDRATRILQDATKNHLLHKRVVEMLEKGWSKFSEAKSQDKREAEASMKLSEFIIAAAEAESFFRGVSNIVYNMSSQHEVLSEQVSCYNMMLKLRDFTTYLKDGDPLKKLVEQDMSTVEGDSENLMEKGW
jgi:DNA primase